MIKTAAIATAALLLLYPAVALGANFAKQSLFLSKSSVTEGDTVELHAVVSNQASDKFSGTLVFTGAGAALGTVPVALAAGESSVVSVSWKPAAGSQPVEADLKDSTSAVVETQKATFDIAAKPTVQTSDDESAAAVESSQGIQDSVSRVSPQAESYAAPVFTLVDGARSSAADVIDNQLDSTKAKLGANPGVGDVLGAEATKNAASNPLAAFLYMLNTLYFYLLTVLRFIIGSAGVFYPLVAILFLFFLWRMFRRFRRPAY